MVAPSIPFRCDQQTSRVLGKSRSLALKRFAALYEGTWRLEPEASGLKVMMIGDGAAQVYVPIVFTIGAPGQQSQPARFLMNLVLTKTANAWKVSSILPVPALTP
jgi:hypothetical protein